jgi:hypothetical protein
MKFPNLTSTPVECPDTQVPRPLTFKLGTQYEIRCSADVVVASGQSPPGFADIRVRPDSPLLFTADVTQARVAAATATRTMVWLREVPQKESAR